MAERRMASRQIVCTDTFRELSTAAQALYFQLLMEADDDGFVASPNGVVGSSPRYSAKAMNELVASRYVLRFKSRVVCIKHWLIMNKVKKDRYRPTACIKERESLVVKPNMAYTEKEKAEPKRNQSGTNLEPIWNQSGSVGKDRIVKDSEGYKIDPRAREGSIDLSSPSDEEFIISAYMKFNPAYAFDVPRDRVLEFLKGHTVDEFETAIKKAKNSDYLSGKANVPKMSLSWALDEPNFKAILSGKYDNWKEEREKADQSYDLDDFFEKAASRGRKSIE